MNVEVLDPETVVRSTARFVKFRQHNEAAKALEELSGAEVLGRAMRLSKAAAR